MQFNEKLKELRLKKGISQTELAEKIFVSRSAVAKWENGLGLPSDDSLNQLAEFFEVEREELYSDKVTESVIVEKNKTISKSRKLLIIISAVCLAIVIAFIVTVAVMIVSSHDKPIGGDTGIMVGVRGDIYEYDEDAECGNYSKKLTNSQTTYPNDYILEVNKKYVVEVYAQQSGGSMQVWISAGDVTLIYDNDVFDIELFNEYKNYDEPLTNLPPKYLLTVKKQCQFSSIIICSHNFYECLIINATEV